VWSPLGWGRLTGKIRRGQPLPEVSRLRNDLTREGGPPIEMEHVYDIVEAIDAVARAIGKTVPQIAINWLLQRPTVSTVIIGARNEEQLRQTSARSTSRCRPSTSHSWTLRLPSRRRTHTGIRRSSRSEMPHRFHSRLRGLRG